MTLIGTLTNNPKIKQSGAGTLELSTGATLTNSAAGSYTFQADGSVAGGTITNAGTVEKTMGTGTATITAALNNTGTVSVSSGTLDLAGTGHAGLRHHLDGR